MWASLGAALGAALLYLAFHHLGWARLFAAYPDVVRSSAWGDATRGDWPAGTPEAEKVAFDLPTIKAWLRKFLIRFFQTSQFKRSALPNGPKVVTGGSLSPRGDWRAPSDGNANVWLAELVEE